MISYKGLRMLLAEKNLRWYYLKNELGINSTVIAKFNKDQYVNLEILERICMHFDCQISDLVEIKKDPVD